VLAAGEGTRLQALTTTASGVAIPKQFCSLGGGASLLHEALSRARVVAAPDRTCVIVAAQHRPWWQSLQYSIPAQNIIVQPLNRGTANGILLPLLQILHRDPHASLLVLPSDHYVRSASVLASSLQQAVAQVDRHRDRIILLGFAPEEADPELGYIVPAGPGMCEVDRFVEKPALAFARTLIGQGALWNSLIFAVNAATLLAAFEERCPQVIREMREIITAADGEVVQRRRLETLYERLPVLDFSRDIITHCAPRLRVLAVPPCGWSDLGTPRRVAEAVDRDAPIVRNGSAAAHALGFLDLAAQHILRQPAG
jgi:mannose-1-phosphate guanylyltransferase